ncbi:MAG: hypothetical protein RIA65_17240 [Woeseia sp.]
MPNSALRLIILVLFAAAPIPGFAQDFDHGSSVDVCNKGDIDLHYVAFGTNNSFFGGYTAKISAWHKVEPGDCEDVAFSDYETIALGFLQINDRGVRGNPVYVLEDATRIGSTEWAPAVLCVPTNDRLDDDNTHGVLVDRYSPPCDDGFAEFKMSFGVIANGNWPTYNLTARGSDLLMPWPATSATPSASAPSTSNSSSSNTMSNAEIAARILLGAAKGLEDGKIRQIASVCESSILTMAFAFSKEGPTQACNCIATNIVKQEPSAVVSGMITDIEADRDFDTVYGRIPEANFERYLESCITPLK